MRSNTWLLLSSITCACATGTLAPKPTLACTLAAVPEPIAVTDARADELHEFFDVADDPAWWAPAPEVPSRANYRAALASRLGAPGLAPRALLARQRAIHAALPGELTREIENSDALASGKAGSFSPVTCLEWRLFERQHRRFPMIERPTEFSAYVLRGRGRLRIYLSGDDRVGGRLREEVTERVVADVAAGYAPVAHVHNHPFMFDRQPGDRTWATEATRSDIAGALAPSLTDVQLYRAMRERFGLSGAWVTNGLDTARYTAEDFDRLSAWP